MDKVILSNLSALIRKVIKMLLMQTTDFLLLLIKHFPSANHWKAFLYKAARESTALFATNLLSKEAATVNWKG